MSRLPWMTVQEVAEQMQVSPRTVTELIRSGELRAIRVGREWRIVASDLEAFANAHSNLPRHDRE